tara:strand:+ start:257 stop:1723 length:1467 start_codon:yes stop_codon:yes gene_type:complete
MKPTILIIPLIMLFLSCDTKDGADDGSVNVTISISFPEDQSTVNDSVLIQCEVSNDNLVSKIELWVDGDSTGIHDLSSPFSVIWDTRYYENGSHSFFVRSYDDQENKFDSETITVTISNFLVFSTTYGEGETNESGRSILQIADSSIIILGENGNDILLLKSDRHGNVEWQQTFGGSQLDRADHIENTSDGGYIISATTESYGPGGKDIWLIKTDPSGLIEWNTYLGTPYDDNAGQVMETSDGGFILIGDQDRLGQGDSDIWLIKTNSQGDSLWTKLYGGSQPDHGSDVLPHEDGGFVLLGSTESQGNGGKDIWLIKVDDAGNEEWDHVYGNGSDDIGQSIIQTNDGGYMIRYIIESYGEGNTSVGLLRLDPSRQEIWTKTIGGSKGIPGTSFQKVGNEEYIMSCSLFDNGNNAYNAYLIKINDSGDVLWDATFGDIENDQARSVVHTHDGGYAVAGSTNNFGNGDKFTSDLWLIKTNSEGFSANFEY